MSSLRRMPPEKVRTSGLPRVAEQPRDEHEVLVAGEILVHRRELAGEADALAHLRGLARDVVAEHAGDAAVGAEQRAEDADGGGLAGAVGSEKTVHGAALDLEVDAVYSFGVAEVLDQFSRFDGERHGWNLRAVTSFRPPMDRATE